MIFFNNNIEGTLIKVSSQNAKTKSKEDHVVMLHFKQEMLEN